MTLKEQLDAQRARGRGRLPVETLALMDQGTETLRQSGLANRCLKAGDTMPTFTLPNASGQPVSSAALLARGPLVVSFYRGGW